MNFVFRKNSGNNYFTDEHEIRSLINKNKIKDCLKLPLVKVGDFVTCCHVKDSLNPTRNISTYKKHSWKENRIILVTSVQIDMYYKIRGVRGEKVHTSGVRFSTKEEIEKYKKENSLNFK